MNFTKKSGFTLVELMVAIAILGILTLGVQAYYGAAQAKARDGVRQVILTEVNKLMQLRLSDTGKVFITRDEFQAILDENSYKIDVPGKKICFFISSVPANENPLHTEEYIIATWGESTSTKTPGVEGILAKGSAQSVQNITHANINGSPAQSILKEDFLCDNPIGFQKVYQAFIGDVVFGN